MRPINQASSAAPATASRPGRVMKAVEMSRFGEPEVLELVEIPTPEAGPGQVRIRVRAAGINFAETLMRRSRYAMTPPLPSVLGSEVAGVIEQLGSGVTGLTIGQRVAGALFAYGAHFGGYAEYAVIDAGFVVPLPASVSFEDATALMVQGLTAAFLIKQASPKGKTVLVNAAAGGVGSMLVQLAKRSGAKSVVAGVSTAEKIAFARSLGANDVVDYTRASWTDDLRAANGGIGPDIVYESVGGAVTAACLDALAPLGQMVVYGALNIQDFHLGVPELLSLIFKNQSLTGFALAPLLTPETLQEELANLFDLAASGVLKVKLGGIFPLARVADAHRALENRETTGKLVLVP